MATSEILVKILGDSKGIEAALGKTESMIDSVFGPKLGSVVKNGAKLMAGAFAADMAKEAITAVTQISDEYASMSSRIKLINDGLQSNKELMDAIHDSANRSRMSYQDTAAVVGKLGILAKDAFGSNQEMIFFAEQMNKQFKIGGASIQEQTAAMYQLTQAMASGRLQGDEFRSILENAPMLAQAIATEMGTSIAGLRELSFEGAITADIIKNAMISSAEETNAKFAEMPMTFAEMWQVLQNDALQAFQPVSEQIGSLNQSGILQSVVEGIIVSLRVLAVVASTAISIIQTGFSAASVVLQKVGTTAKTAFGVFPQMLPIIVGLLAGYAAYMSVVNGGLVAMAAKTALVTAAKAAFLVIIGALWVGMKTAMVIQAAWNAVMAISNGITTVASAKTAILNGLLAVTRVRTLAASAAQAVYNAVVSMNPIALLVGLLAVLAGAFLAGEVATNGFGATMSSIWSSIVHTTVWAVNQVISLVNKLIDGLNSVGSVLGKIFKFDYSAITAISEISADSAQDVVNWGNDLGAKLGKAFDVSSASPEQDIPSSSNYSADGGGAGGGSGRGGSGGGSGAANNDLQEAESLHKSILDEYDNMFKTKSELADKWLRDELEELEKSKANNLNYEKDKQMIMEMYARKREEALHEEAKRIREIQNSIRDLKRDFDFNTLLTDSNGDRSPVAKLVKDHEDAVASITDKWQEQSDKYAEMTAQDRATFLKSLDDRNIAYEVLGNGQISFEKMKNQELLAELAKYNKERADLIRTQAEEEWAIKEAMRTQDFTALQALLTDEYIAMQQNYELRKELLNEYQEAVMQSHWNAMQVMYDAQTAGIDSLEESISGLLQGTTTLTAAFQNLGKAILKSISDSVAGWLAAQLRQMLFGKMLQSQQTAASIAAAEAQTPAWTNLAQQVSIATFGAAAVTGMAAYTSAIAGMSAMNSLSNGITGGVGSLGSGGGQIGSVTGGISNLRPRLGLASGGLAYGETWTKIGEGKYPEAVLPLSDDVFSRIGDGIAKSDSGGQPITLNISAMDASSFEEWLERTGGRILRQFTVNTERDFGTEIGVV